MCAAVLSVSPAAWGLLKPIPKVAVLEFELKDYTPTPNSPAEIAETHDAARLLRQSLGTVCGYDMVTVDSTEQRSAEGGGEDYLFSHPDEVARLGRKAGADWVVLGELVVATPIVSEFHVELIRASRGTLAAAVTIELKGDSENGGPVFAKAIDQVARQIDRELAQPGKGGSPSRCPAAG
jgi:hypothetical protein